MQIKPLLRILILVVAGQVVLDLSSCNLDTGGGNNNLPDQRAIDDQAIADYLAQNGKTATKTELGIYKVEVSPGSGPDAVNTDILHLDLKLYNFEGQQFFSDTTYVVMLKNGVYLPNLSGSIPGLVASSFLLSAGEEAEFYIPSYLFFRSDGGYYNDVLINPNEIIVARIKLKGILNPVQQRTYEDQVIASILKDSTGFYRESNGLYRKTVVEGTGLETPQSNTIVQVNLHGAYLDGSVFVQGSDIQFVPQNTIEGFGQALLEMKRGETATVYIPSQLAYGPVGNIDATGVPEVGAYKTLRFEITIVHF